MRKDQQDLAWACLPKETRIAMRRDYAAPTNSKRDIGFNSALSLYFGHHNLTSDTEPDELLYVTRNTVIEFYKDAKDRLNLGRETEAMKHHLIAERNLLFSLFGDKCMPDKEPIVSNNETKGDTIDEQPKPKYSKGDKVITLFGSSRITATIIGVGDHGEYDIIDDKGNKFYHCKSTELEPNTEGPEAKQKDTQSLSLSITEKKNMSKTVQSEDLIFRDNNRTALAHVWFCDGELCVSIVAGDRQYDFGLDPLTLKMLAYGYKLHCEELPK